MLRAQKSHSGFTTIELLVAITIAGIVMIGLGTLAIGGFSNSQKSEAERQAFDDITNVARSFSDDIGRSKSAQRSEDVVTDTTALSKALLQDEPLKYTKDGQEITVDVADILYATGQELHMRTDRDVLDRATKLPGQDGLNDCVLYYIDLSGGVARVIREVAAYVPPAGGQTRGTCDKTAVTDRQVMIERVKIETAP
jgi:prepilin-type N-terminal cleavage/methylation domain-containing protein